MTTTINDPRKCGWCNGFHTGKCPLVKAIEYHPDGTTKRVEFYAPKDYPPITGGSFDLARSLAVGDSG
jgi:hypothetical protein